MKAEYIRLKEIENQNNNNKEPKLSDIIKTLIIMSLFVLILFFMISSVNGYDKLENITLNTSQLPKSGEFSYTFQLSENSTLFFNENESNSKLQLDFVNNYTFQNDSTYDFKVNWNITEDTWISNETLKSSIIVTNNRNSNKYEIGYNFNIIKVEKPVVIINGSSELKIVNGTYQRIITSNKLPDKNNLSFVIEGVPGSKFNFSFCSDWLECPTGNQVFRENGQYLLTIPYSVPFTIALGNYNKTITIQGENLSKNITVSFYIQPPKLVMQPLELDPRCTSEAPPNVMVECYQKINDYNAEILAGFQQYLANINTEKICAEYKQIEYVVGDSIGEEIINTNKELRDEITYCNEVKTKFQEENIELKATIKDKDNEINSTINRYENKIIDIKEESIKQKASIANDAIQFNANWLEGKKTFILSILIVLLIIPAILQIWQYIGYYMQNKNIYINPIFLYSWIGIVGLLILLVALIL